MPRKKHDPLWEIVDEKIPLQGGAPDIDAQCPYCHVTVHLGTEPEPGRRVECGLCGGVSLENAEAGRCVLSKVQGPGQRSLASRSGV